MAEKDLTGNSRTEANVFTGKAKSTKFLRILMLVSLPFLWIGYVYALYSGNDRNVSSYSLMIIAFSLLELGPLCGAGKMEPKALTILSKVDGILFFTWAAITVVSTILK